MERIRLTDLVEFAPERFTKRIGLNSPQVTVFVLNFGPGQALPTHTHPGAVLTVQGLSGRVELSAGEHEGTLGAGEISMVSGEVPFHLVNNGTEPASVLVTLITIGPAK